eukprot:GHVU01066774.1.p1 GENE.GHVU01066774.1~~GHVU01066774.1.p1  ORF type:complete len:127 (+),score=6.60 GHVU01066774.1:660-1040(+)
MMISRGDSSVPAGGRWLPVPPTAAAPYLAAASSLGPIARQAILRTYQVEELDLREPGRRGCEPRPDPKRSVGNWIKLAISLSIYICGLDPPYANRAPIPSRHHSVEMGAPSSAHARKEVTYRQDEY